MRITKINSQHRRDFTAVYECESCGHTKIDRGYDDHYFHHHVVPAMKCDKCGKSAPAEFRPLGTKHAADEVV